MTGIKKISIEMGGRTFLEAAEDLEDIAKALRQADISRVHSRLVFGPRAANILIFVDDDQAAAFERTGL